MTSNTADKQNTDVHHSNTWFSFTTITTTQK